MAETPAERLNKIMLRMRKLPLGLGRFRAAGMSGPQIILLKYVADFPGVGVKEMAERMGLAAPTISVGIRRLVRKGLLERRRDVEDKRARPLYLTFEGEQLVQQVQAHHARMVEVFLSGLAKREQEELFRLLEKVVAAAEEKMQAGSQGEGN